MMVATRNLHRPSPTLARAATLLAFSALGAQASTLTFYSSQTSFAAAEPGTSTVTSAAASGLGPGLYLQSSPVGSTTVSSNLAPGSIPPGITISNGTAALTPGLIFYTAGQITGSGAALGTNWFGDPLVMTFNPAVNAVGANVFAATGPGQTLAGLFSEQVFDGTTLLGSTTFSEAAGTFGFMGVSSTSPITSIQLLYTTDDASTFANNIAFAVTGSGGITTPPVTTPGGGGGSGTGSGPGTPTGPGQAGGPGVGEGSGSEGGTGTPGTAVTPEPSTWTLLLTGLVLLFVQVRKPMSSRSRA